MERTQLPDGGPLRDGGVELLVHGEQHARYGLETESFVAALNASVRLTPSFVNVMAMVVEMGVGREGE